MSLLNNAPMPTLHISRLRCIAAGAYKCIYNLSPDYIRDLLELKQSSYNFRYENTAKVPKVRTTAYGKKSFRFEAARVWNSLPNEMRTAEKENGPHLDRPKVWMCHMQLLCRPVFSFYCFIICSVAHTLAALSGVFTAMAFLLGLLGCMRVCRVQQLNCSFAWVHTCT